MAWTGVATETRETWEHKFAFLLLAAAFCYGLWYLALSRRRDAPAPIAQAERAQAVEHQAGDRPGRPSTTFRRPLRRRMQVPTADPSTLPGGTNASEQLSMDDVASGVASGLKKLTGGAGGSRAEGKSDVVKVKAPSDNAFYFVADDLPNKEQAADKLAEVNRRSQTLLEALDDKLAREGSAKTADGKDITQNIRTLLKKHLGKPVPMAEYHCPNDLTVGSNSDKGALVEMCLRDKADPAVWNSDNTLFRVHVHELAHSADFEYRGDGDAAHGPVFKRLHQYLLGVSEANGLYNCAEYKKSGMRFCGLKLSEEYCGE